MLSCRMCSVLVVLSTATAAVGDSGVAHGANLADLNLSIDRLTRKLEKLTVSWLTVPTNSHFMCLPYLTSLL